MKGCKSWLLAMFLCVPLIVRTVEPESCALVRFADIGWTDITVTIAVTRQILGSPGYKTEVNLLSVPVTYCSLTNNDLDVFLGSWMSTMTSDIKQYTEKDTIETLRANLEGTKYTLAVPQYAYDGGLRSLADIVKFSDKLGNKTHGIEPGNDGNRVAQSTIDKNALELGKFKLMEPNEVSMLLQVQRVIRRNQWVVLLGQKPHPMNTRFQMEYLEGGNDLFDPNYGDAAIYTDMRKGYAQERVNADQLLKNFSFVLKMENELVDAALNENKEPEEVVKAWLKDHPEQLDTWLAGVTTHGGQPTAATVRLAFAKQATGHSSPALDGS